MTFENEGLQAEGCFFGCAAADDQAGRQAVKLKDVSSVVQLLTTRQAVKLKRVTKGHPGAHAALCAQVH